MNKVKKTALLVAAVLIVAGLILSIGAMSSVSFDVTRLDTTKITTETHEVKEDFQNIRISTDVYDVQVLPSKDGQCKVVSTEETNLRCSISIEDDTLVIEQIDRRNWWKYIGFHWRQRELRIYLPKTEYGEFTMDCVSGDVKLPEDFTFTEVSLSNTSGDMEIGAEVTGTLSVETLSGDLELHNITAKNVDLQTVSGDMECFRVIAQEQMQMESTSGEIKLKQCDADTLFFKTVSGDVEGTLLSGKVFDVDTVTGDVKVPTSGQGGMCQIETISGDVKIDTAN